MCGLLSGERVMVVLRRPLLPSCNISPAQHAGVVWCGLGNMAGFCSSWRIWRYIIHLFDATLVIRIVWRLGTGAFYQDVGLCRSVVPSLQWSVKL